MEKVGNTNNALINSLVEKYSREMGIELKLLKAIIETESNWNMFAIRYEPRYMWLYEVNRMAKEVICSMDTMKYAQCCSWGLMQIMGAVAYERGFRDWPTKLCLPDINLKYGCEYLADFIMRYGDDPYDIYAAYNAGSVRMINGDYVNRGNVNNFRKVYDRLTRQDLNDME